MSQSQIEKLQLEQMSLYAEMLESFSNAANILSRISDYLTIADFSNHDDIQMAYNAIYQSNVAFNALTLAFKFYAESHLISLTDPS